MSPSTFSLALPLNRQLHALRFDRVVQVKHDIAELSPSSILTNGALPRSLASIGVVNRFVVSKKQHTRKSFSSIASNMRLELVKCPSTTARTSAERFPEDFGGAPQ